MKFKKDDLIARIDNLMHQLEGEAIAASEEYDEKLAGSKDAWLEDHRIHWLMFSEAIRKKLHSGLPVTPDIIPPEIKGGSNSSLKFYFEPFKENLNVNRRYDNLQKLRNALCASQEDTVSPTAIKQLGFQDVTFLFTQEAAA